VLPFIHPSLVFSTSFSEYSRTEPSMDLSPYASSLLSWYA
jgi:hypothetical protein